ncbi:MAG: endonuclease [Crocinitomicaceae bacterium]
MKFISLLLVFISLPFAYSQDFNSSVLFYNVENLFDTLDTPGKDDGEFLPEGNRSWNSARYQEKLDHVNQVINDLDNPVIIGLCEIENRQVVEDIVSNDDLSGTHTVVHHESLDNRGIDNAIIYDSTQLSLVEDGIVRFNMPEGNSPSRDILWAKFERNGECVYVMVNHWPSRRGGQMISEPKRLIAANAAQNFIDSLQNANRKAQIIFMGDLNDYPTDKAPKMISSLLKPLITEDSGEYGGTNCYRGEWNVLDHIMVSKPTTKKKGSISVDKKSGTIHSFEYLLTEYKGNIVPFRTYGGGKYLAGYSDHLPVSIKIKLK